MNELLLRQQQQQQQIAHTSPASVHVMSDPGTMPTFLATGEMGGYHHHHHWRGVRYPLTQRDNDAGVFQFQTPGIQTARPVQSRRSGFDIREEPVSDFISRGMMTADQAMSCFGTYVDAILRVMSKMLFANLQSRFFQGCVGSPNLSTHDIWGSCVRKIRIGISRSLIQILIHSTLCALGVASCSMLFAQLAVELRSVCLMPVL